LAAVQNPLPAASQQSLKEICRGCESVFVRIPNVFVPGAEDPDATRSSLVRRLGNWNDHGGWQDFFDRYWKLIYAVAVKAGLSDSEAQDVVQETVVAVAKQMRDGGYDRTKSSFKNWLCLITRRRIIDHFRRRTKLMKQPLASEGTSRTDTIARVPDPASLELDAVWDEEWRKNLADAAIENVKQQVAPKQFQIFDLSVLKDLPVREVTKLLKVNAAQVYLARHRVGALVKKEVARLEAQAEKAEVKG
jgi:RNA polymerase sigma-70 factor (ECF subfamily)